MIKLIGFMDSPFVRRVAVSARFLNIDYDHRELSIFRDYDAFREISPLVKVPTVICDDGEILVESTLIIDYLESLSGKSLMPAGLKERANALGIIGVALIAAEKTVQLIYETRQRPQEKRHDPWIERLTQQLTAAIVLLEASIGDGVKWLAGADMSQADITAAIVWRFVQHSASSRIAAGDYPGLVAFSAHAEAQPQFIACPLS